MSPYHFDGLTAVFSSPLCSRDEGDTHKNYGLINHCSLPTIGFVLINKQRRVRRRQRKNGGPARVATNTTKYSGPVVLPRVRGGDDTIMANLIVDGAVTSSGGGVINSVFKNGDVTSAGDFSGYAGQYSEYRVLGMSVQFIPNTENAIVSANAYTPLYEVVARGVASGTALTSYADASEYASMRSHSLTRKWSTAVRMDSTDEAAWTSTSIGLPNLFGNKWYATGLSNTTTYGRYREVFLVQFRNRAD